MNEDVDADANLDTNAIINLNAPGTISIGTDTNQTIV